MPRPLPKAEPAKPEARGEAEAGSLPGQLLALIRNRKFNQAARLFDANIDFQAWTPTGRWVAADPATAARIIEVWFTPGGGPSNVVFSSETSAGRGLSTLEFEIEWKVQPDDQPRVLRQAYLLTIKPVAEKSGGRADRIVAMRVYCAGPHTEFPEVDLEKQRRVKGLSGAKPLPAKGMTARVG